MQEIGLRHYAYVGDAVWELFIRERTVFMTQNAQKLHKISTDFVRAKFQADLLEKLDEILTDEEKELARRGRNLPIPVARRAIQTEYRKATAFETLIGWWYFNDKTRLDEILNILEKAIRQ